MSTRVKTYSTKEPKVSCRCYVRDYSGHYGNHAMEFHLGPIRCYFSYNTLIGLEVDGQAIYMENQWGPTTGKHLRNAQWNSRGPVLSPSAFRARAYNMLRKYFPKFVSADIAGFNVSTTNGFPSKLAPIETGEIVDAKYVVREKYADDMKSFHTAGRTEAKKKQMQKERQQKRTRKEAAKRAAVTRRLNREAEAAVEAAARMVEELEQQTQLQRDRFIQQIKETTFLQDTDFSAFAGQLL